MKERARAVVIGGGVGGCAILYWLARIGWSDVVLLERADLTSGSTFHSAGLVGQLRSSLSLTRMMMESVDLYRALADEVGLETGWREVGSLRLASSEERMEEIARQASSAKTFGLPLELISAAEAQELFPPMSVDGVLVAGAAVSVDGVLVAGAVVSVVVSTTVVTVASAVFVTASPTVPLAVVVVVGSCAHAGAARRLQARTPRSAPISRVTRT